MHTFLPKRFGVFGETRIQSHFSTFYVNDHVNSFMFSQCFKTFKVLRNCRFERKTFEWAVHTKTWDYTLSLLPNGFVFSGERQNTALFSFPTSCNQSFLFSHSLINRAHWLSFIIIVVPLWPVILPYKHLYTQSRC